ncbi:hypothetical protein CGC59_05595 [Capnocytophaga sputigena]|jgi:lipoprotein|uniref:TonB C-terminal domain-containing protein n=1 Tax=Capnocytophaga sputigena TaxID=1019 RepID=A0A250F221_CAPSP|nr:energy transducer TonB [Capnocytophaga sputigena]ATA79194.1 hypothetical protein CGC59_05595 [Capnocytophaga sputigena]
MKYLVLIIVSIFLLSCKGAKRYENNIVLYAIQNTKDNPKPYTFKEIQDKIKKEKGDYFVYQTSTPPKMNSDITSVDISIEKYFKQNFIYPIKAYKEHLQGQVIFNIRISKEGKLEIITLKGTDEIFEKEVSRILKQLANNSFIPAVKNRRKVNAIMSFGVVFKFYN